MYRTRLFRVNPPLVYLRRLVETTCTRDEDAYVLTNDCFKRVKLLGRLSEIQNELRGFYVFSKQSYVNNMSTYIGFSNVFRQLCRYHGVDITGQVVYVHSTYQMEYRIGIHSD